MMAGAGSSTGEQLLHGPVHVTTCIAQCFPCLRAQDQSVGVTRVRPTVSFDLAPACKLDQVPGQRESGRAEKTRTWSSLKPISSSGARSWVSLCAMGGTAVGRSLYSSVPTASCATPTLAPTTPSKAGGRGALVAGATDTPVVTAVCTDGISSASAALGGTATLVGTAALIGTAAGAAAAAGASLWSGFLTDISAAGLGSSEFCWARVVANCETAHHARAPHSTFNTRHGNHRGSAAPSQQGTHT